MDISPMGIPLHESHTQEQLTMSNSNYLMWLGVISLVLGFLALFNPVASTIAAEMIVAWSLMIVGIGQLVSAFNQKDGENRLGLGLLGVLGFFLGLYLIYRPVMGALTLTMIVALFILVEGLVKVYLALRFKGTPYFGGILLSAIVSILLAILILSNYPESAMTILGILLAVQLISIGINLLALGKLLTPTLKLPGQGTR
ncbi:hypothetical protein B9Z51_01795 [Limnohabitans sp. T6-5]|uniref:HdeD family acid-resistance protein n=1 Tax=Limnohabitans sp. T6-5 TaxID=1100724 RepID=UPI000D35BAC8|nr:DUF308 domain-containing protein [Limnohabitans sp. T6-5]PUE11083.1 hypothetical protein B9Z51_01795 [Limnohabitans sp. T6-5]